MHLLMYTLPHMQDNLHKLKEYDWLIQAVQLEAMRGELRCFITERGVLCATMAGHTPTPELFAGRL